MSKYRRDYLIGAGGMGKVYRATRMMVYGDERPVACKVMRSHMVAKPNGVQRFHQEARLTVELDHDHIVRFIDYQVDDAGELYLITELVQGVSVAELVDGHADKKRLSFDMVRVIADDVLDALNYVHSCGVLHRDISPGNLLVCQSGAIKVADFGVAKAMASDARQSGNYIGKIAYLAPEVCKGASIDSRSDLFSVAATLYELLAGEAPFGTEMPAAAIRRQECDIAPLPEDVPDDLRVLVMGLLAKAPEDRQPQTAQDARALLRIPTDPKRVAAELGARSAALYAAKCKRGQRQLKQQRRMAESLSTRMIHANAVVEALETTRPGPSAEAGSATLSTGEAVNGTAEQSARSNRAERLAARTQRTSTGRSRATLTLAALATFILIIIGDDGGRGDCGTKSADVSIVRLDRSPPRRAPAHSDDGAEKSGLDEVSEQVECIPDVNPATEEPPTRSTRPVPPIEISADKLDQYTQPSHGPGSAWVDDWVHVR